MDFQMHRHSSVIDIFLLPIIMFIVVTIGLLQLNYNLFEHILSNVSMSKIKKVNIVVKVFLICMLAMITLMMIYFQFSIGKLSMALLLNMISILKNVMVDHFIGKVYHLLAVSAMDNMV